MLSYQHGYHAGNFADVVKHLTLTRLINYLNQKDKALFYLETHAGRGLYDFKDSKATKTAEFEEGIALLWEQRKNLSPLFAPYLDVIKSLNETNILRFYPGSPQLALSGLRAQDRMIFSELHPREFSHLEQLRTHGKKAFFSQSDGIKNLHALLPPPERRGLIFIDPSYEIKDEYKTIPAAINSAYLRFSTGVYCLWYPIIGKHEHEKLVRGMNNIKAAQQLRIEFTLTSGAKSGMTGCGLWVINPPYTLKTEMETILNSLRTIFNPGVSSYLINTGV